MTGVSAVRDALASRLGTITGLNVYSTFPAVPQAPCVIVQPTTGDYDLSLANGGETMNFDLVLLAIQIASPFDVAQDAIDPYLDRSGSTSLRATINADVSLGGTVHTCRVKGWQNYGTINLGGSEYLGAKLAVEVWPL